jgi:hypothetical protein
MRVASAFRKVGFRVSQSDYYVDPNTKRSREIDVVASIQKSTERYTARVQFVVECKSSIHKPWVVFASSGLRLADPARVAQRGTSEIGMRALMLLAHRTEIQQLDLFTFEETVGYSLIQGFSKDSDTAFAALMGAANAAKAEAIDANRHSKMRHAFITFVFPLVAIDGKLFRCTLQKDAELGVEEIPAATLLWRNPVVDPSHTIVQLLTAGIIDKWAERAAASSTAFLESCDHEIIEAMRLASR